MSSILQQHREQAASQRAHHADAGPCNEEHAQDRALGGAHGAQDADLAALVLHQHDEAGDDVEGGHHDDDRQDDEHHVALHLEHREEAGVALAPVDETQRRDAQLLHGRHRFLDSLRVLHHHLEHIDGIALVEEALRLGQRHEDHAAVELRHAHLEHRRHLVALGARHGAERRARAARGGERDGVAHVDAQQAHEAGADGDGIRAVVEAVEGAELDVVDDLRERA
jgi:hypothetical protein